MTLLAAICARICVSRSYPASMHARILSAFILLTALAVGPELRAADNEVTGTFTGDGKAAKIAFVSTVKGTELEDKPTVMIVFTEKDHSKDKRPDMGAMFGKYGSAIIITVFPDTGKIVGCEVAHDAHQKKPFSSLGSLEIADYKNEAGQLSGRIATASPVETFKQKWELNLTFKAKAP